MNLGEKILEMRTKANMSQGDLAEALNVSRQSVPKWETNSSTPELDKLLKMSEIFKISIDDSTAEKLNIHKMVNESSDSI
ncbi:MAG: helix-turn-helix transcriptional regulator, partial [Peptostreptococcaceae bacterium]|nr:helix-turn-helix transcriptional regulator [Peptostreptococcaceae bacterium]